jgi:hypothetical protein
MKKIARLNLFLLLALFAFINIGCDKENQTVCDGEIGEFQDFTGLDGCGILLVLEDGTRLENTNLAFFDIELGVEYCVEYTEVDRGSICMVGKTVEIDKLEKI